MAKLKTIMGAIALGEFTIQQLHKRTGVATSTLHTIIDRNPELFIEIGKDRTHRPGGQPCMYRVQLEAAKAYVHDQTHPTTVIGARFQAEYQNLLWRIRKADDATAREIIQRAEKFLEHLEGKGDPRDDDGNGPHRELISALVEFARRELARDPNAMTSAFQARDALRLQAYRMTEIGQAKLAEAIHKRIDDSKLCAWIDEAAQRGAPRRERRTESMEYTVPDRNVLLEDSMMGEMSPPSDTPRAASPEP
ncbi:MAG: hypothetical protein E6J90_07260 [Deltaproteobacteria bacterium]|nr:MAG: hypothetical protein E6J90_07260 [Deltaproteobacteria bacterium]